MMNEEQVQSKQVEIAVLATEMKAGFDSIDRRLMTLEKRTEWLDGDSEQLRRDGDKIAAALERLPCARHAEEIGSIRRKVSEELRSVHSEFNGVRQSETTGKIELARLESAQKARVEILEEIQRERKELQATITGFASARDKTWKRVSIALGLIIAAISPFIGWVLVK